MYLNCVKALMSETRPLDHGFDGSDLAASETTQLDIRGAGGLTCPMNSSDRDVDDLQRQTAESNDLASIHGQRSDPSNDQPAAKAPRRIETPGSLNCLLA
jgi:hypothetical protein